MESIPWDSKKKFETLYLVQFCRNRKKYFFLQMRHRIQNWNIQFGLSFECRPFTSAPPPQKKETKQNKTEESQEFLGNKQKTHR